MRLFPFIIILWTSSHFVVGQEMVKEYYQSGELKGEGRKIDGKKEGEWIFYYPSGKKNSWENYKEGRLHGEVIYFYPTGTKQGQEVWKEGVMQDSAWYF